MTRSRFSALVVAQAVLLVVGLIAIDPRRAPLVYATLFAAACVPWIVMSRAVCAGRITIRWRDVLIAAVVLRCVVQLAYPAVLSDDIWRYLWEGRVQLAGFNPFVDAPAELEHLGRGDPVWERMNNRAIPAAYPPVGQLFLRALAFGGLAEIGTRTAFAALDLATFLLLSLALRGRGLDPRRALLHGLCPLPIVEMCVEGHNDALGIALFVAALAAWAFRSRHVGGALFGAAAAAKYLPLVLVPQILRRIGFVPVLVAMTVFAISFALYWPSKERVPELFEGLGEYGARWRHNDSGFVALRFVTATVQEWCRDLGATSWFATAHEDRVAKIPLALLFLMGVILVYRTTRSAEDVVERSFVYLMLILFALTPTLHPWYVCWVVPALAFVPHPAAFALIAMSGFSYHVLERFHHGDGAWVEQPIWKIVEYAPFYVTLIVVAVRARKTRSKVSMTVGPSNLAE